MQLTSPVFVSVPCFLKMEASRRKEKKVSIIGYLSTESAGRVTSYFVIRRVLDIKPHFDTSIEKLH